LNAPSTSILNSAHDWLLLLNKTQYCELDGQTLENPFQRMVN